MEFLLEVNKKLSKQNMGQKCVPSEQGVISKCFPLPNIVDIWMKQIFERTE